VDVITTTRRKNLTEPLASVTASFGIFMLLAAAVVAGFAIFGPGSVLSSTPCVTVPGITENSSAWRSVAFTAKPGASLSVIGSTQACALHPGIGQWALYALAELPTFAAWGGVLLLLWRMLRAAERTGPFSAGVATAMRRLGLFVLIGSATVALVRAVSLAILLNGMLQGQGAGSSLFASLASAAIRAVMPVPLLAGAGLLTLARIFRVGVVMNDDLQGTV
jgi:hypothetical protein